MWDAAFVFIMATQTTTKNVVLFGSSVANGLGAPNRRGWAQSLESHLYDLNPHPRHNNDTTFSNLAVIGDTSYDVEEAIRNGEAHRRRRPLGCAALSIVAVGSQDVWKDFKNKGEDLDLAGFADRMGRIALQLFDQGDVLYVGIPTPDLPRMTAMSARFSEVTLADAAGAIREYEQTAARVMAQAAPEGRSYQAVPLFDASVAAGPAYTHARDMVHPAAEGHEWIYNQVVPVFDAMVGIKGRA